MDGIGVVIPAMTQVESGKGLCIGAFLYGGPCQWTINAQVLQKF